VSDLQRAVLGANALVGELSDRVSSLRGAVQQAPRAPATLDAQVRTLELQLRDLREAFSGDPTLARRQEPTPPVAHRPGGRDGAGRARHGRAHRDAAPPVRDRLGRLRHDADPRARARRVGDRKVETAAEAAGVPVDVGPHPAVAGDAVAPAARRRTTQDR
jgi:hypothetical protein